MPPHRVGHPPTASHDALRSGPCPTRPITARCGDAAVRICSTAGCGRIDCAGPGRSPAQVLAFIRVIFVEAILLDHVALSTGSRSVPRLRRCAAATSRAIRRVNVSIHGHLARGAAPIAGYPARGVPSAAAVPAPPRQRAYSKALSKKSITRCSYAAGWAVSPPVWDAPGMTHSVLGCPAAAK